MRRKMLPAWRWRRSHFLASLVIFSPPRRARRSNPAEHRIRSLIPVDLSHDQQSDILFSRTSAFLAISPRLSHPVRSLLQAAEAPWKFATTAHRLRLGQDLWCTRPTTCQRRSGDESPARSRARSIADAPERSAWRAASSRRSVGAGRAVGGRSILRRAVAAGRYASVGRCDAPAARRHHAGA